jgi:lipopolysaccharide export system permease protein
MNLAQSLEYLELIRGTSDDDKLRELKVRIQQKVSFPFVCLVFGLVGATLGTKPQQTGRGTSFGISILIIFGYYLLAFITGAIGQVGILSPFMAAWIPNFIGFGIGGWLLFRSAN